MCKVGGGESDMVEYRHYADKRQKRIHQNRLAKAYRKAQYTRERNALDSIGKPVASCPVCGSSKLKKLKGETWECKDCGEKTPTHKLDIAL